jgi:hypothetical protein
MLASPLHSQRSNLTTDNSSPRHIIARVTTQRTRLRSGPTGTTSWVYFSDKGDLCVELFDHSPMAQEHFGNDVATILAISGVELSRVRQAAGCTTEDPNELLELLASRFGDYFELKSWLEEIRIPFEKTFDGWA